MNTLKELIKFVNKNNTLSNENIGSLIGKNAKLQQLCIGIIEEQFSTDEEAALLLFNKKPSNQSYKNLKSQLKNKLLDVVLITKLPPQNEYRTLYNSIPKKWAAIKLIILNGHRDTGISLAKNVLKQALKIDLFNTSIDILRTLRSYFSVFEHSIKDVEKYDYLLNEQLKIREKELLVEGFFYRLQQQYYRKKSSKTETNKILEELSSQLETFIHPSNSYKTIALAGLVEIARYITRNDYL